MKDNCSIEDCCNKATVRGLCKTHYNKAHKRGDFKLSGKVHERHGKTKSPEYITWDKMKQRCYNPKHNRYHIYGARGITVCSKWKDSFRAFYSDMGDRPEGYTIDRIDCDKGYYPENCQWASVSEQNSNKRKSKNSKSIIIGVRLTKYGTWTSMICCNYDNVHIGSFDNLFDAVAARKKEELERQMKYNKSRIIYT